MRRKTSLSVIQDQLQPLVTACLRVMKPVCISANILLLVSTVFPLATERWDHPGLAFGWNLVTAAKVFFLLGRLPSNTPQPICPLAKPWADLLWASPAFSVLFLPYTTLQKACSEYVPDFRGADSRMTSIIQCNTPNCIHHIKRDILIVTQVK